MSKGKAVLAAVTVIFGAIMTLAPPLAGWYTNRKLREIDEQEGRLPEVQEPAKEGKVTRKMAQEAVRKVREET